MKRTVKAVCLVAAVTGSIALVALDAKGFAWCFRKCEVECCPWSEYASLDPELYPNRCQKCKDDGHMEIKPCAYCNYCGSAHKECKRDCDKC